MRSCLAGKVLLCGLVAFLGASLRTVGGHSQTPVAGASAFEELFEPVRTVQLDLGREQIGLIERLYVDRIGRMLLIDVRFALAFLVDRNGRLIRKLAVEDSLPGYRWQPILGAFGPDGRIVIWSGHRELLSFAADGVFKKAISPKVRILSWKHLVVDEDCNIIGYCILAGGPALIKIDSTGNPLVRPVSLPTEYTNLIRRFEEGGGLVRGTDGFLYEADICCPEIRKYTANLVLDRVFRRSPKFFRKLKPRADRVFADPRQFPAMQRLMRGITQTIHFFNLNDTLLLAQYLVSGDSPPFALQILSTHGRYYPCDDLRYHRPILACAAGKVYVPEPPQILESDDAGYRIRVYQIRFR